MGEVGPEEGVMATDRRRESAIPLSCGGHDAR